MANGSKKIEEGPNHKCNPFYSWGFFTSIQDNQRCKKRGERGARSCYFSTSCANFWAAYAKNMLKYAVLILWRKKVLPADFYAFCISEDN